MKKDLLKIMSGLIILTTLLCGCSTDKKVTTKNQEVTQEVKTERPSEYSEDDKPWGDYNYKNIGVISNLKENLDDNYVLADFTVDGKSVKDKVKIYGTDIDKSKYEGKKVFVLGVKDSKADKNNILIKYYKDIKFVDEGLLNSISALDSIDNAAALEQVKNNISAINDEDYKSYVNELYNSKVGELNNKKQEEERIRQEAEAKAAEERAAQERAAQERARQEQQRQQQQQAASSASQPNSETVYVASSGNGECYHRDAYCSRMNGRVNSMSRGEAEERGFRACKKCY